MRAPSANPFLPLPAVVADTSLRRCLARTCAPGSSRFVGDSQVAAGLLLMARPSTVRASRRANVDLAQRFFAVELEVYEGEEAGPDPTRVFTVPVSGNEDHVFTFFTLLCRDKAPTDLLFSASDGTFPALTTAGRAAALSAGCHPPAACDFRFFAVRGTFFCFQCRCTARPHHGNGGPYF